MIDRLSGIVLLPTDGNPAGPPVDLLIRDGRIAAITPAATPSARRMLAAPALVNAHDHARPLSPTSFGAAAKPLETWLLRLAAMPAIDPYLGALAAFGRAARAGAGSVMAHYTRFHGPMPPVEEARAIARAAADVGVRVTLAVFMRDRNPLVYGGEESLLETMPADARATVEAQFLGPSLGPAEQVARVEAIAEATESATFSVQFGPSGPQWCSDASACRDRGGVAPDRAARAYAFVGDALSARFRRPRLSGGGRAAPEGARPSVAPPDARALRPRAPGRARPDRRVRRDHRHKPKLEPSPQKRHCADFRSPRIGAVASRWASTVRPSTRTTTLCARCGSAIFFMAAGASTASSNAEPGSPRSSPTAASPTARRARGRLRSANLPTFFVLDLDALDRDAVMSVEPIDLVFARATCRACRSVSSSLAKRSSATGGSPASILRRRKRSCAVSIARNAQSRAPFLAAWNALEPAVAQCYQSGFGCC